MTKWIIILLFFLSLGLYTFTLAPSVSPQGDSGELITVAYTLGIAHPPGYPLYTILGHLFSKMPFGSVAWRLNFMAAIMHSLTVALVFLILKRLTRDLLASAIGAIILALSYTFWLYSLVAEVFSLNDLIVVILLYLTLGVSTDDSVVNLTKRFSLMAFFFGLGLANNQTVVLIMPAVLFWIWYVVWAKLRSWPILVLGKSFLIICLSGLAGLLPYVYILIRAKTAVVPVAWSYPDSFHELWKLFVRADYGTFSAIAGHDPALVSLAEKGRQLLTYSKFVSDDFQLGGVFFLGVGFIAGVIKRRAEIIFLSIGLLISGALFLSYSNFPYLETSGTGLEVTERFYLVPNIFLVLVIGLGLSQLFNLARRLRLVRFLTFIAILFYITAMFIGNFNEVNQRSNYLGWHLGRDFLNNAAPKSIVMPMGDVTTFVSFYVHYVEGFRPDILLVTPNTASSLNNFRYQKMVRPDLVWTDRSESSISGVIEANYGRTPIYLGDAIGNLLPAKFVATPSGFLRKVEGKEIVRTFDQWQKDTSKIIASYEINPLTQIKVKTAGDFVVQTAYVSVYLNLGSYCLQVGQYDCALRYYSLANRLDPLRLESMIGLAQLSEKLGHCQEAEDWYLSVIRLNPKAKFQIYATLEKLSQGCFKDDAKGLRYRRLIESGQESGESLRTF